MRLVEERPLDADELSLLDAVREGAAAAVAAGAASVGVRWESVEGATGPWTVVALSPAAGGAPAVFWWMSPDKGFRRHDLTVVELAVGDLQHGILARIGAAERASLAVSVARGVTAFVDGRVSYEASRAEPENYDGPIPAQTLAVSLRWKFATPQGGSGSAVLVGDLRDPNSFTRATRIPISAEVGRREFAAYLEPA